MKRLSDKSDDSDAVVKLIKKLELQIVDGSITDKRLDSLQEKLDKLDDELEEPNYRLYELQSIIYYAKDNKSKALEFIEDAISLEDDATKYSRTGALLAEIYFESTKSADITEDEDEYEENTEIEKELDRENKKLIKELRKKYSGKLEGWLAFYTLRVVVMPIYFVVSALMDMSTLSDYPDAPRDIEVFIYIAILTQFALGVGSFVFTFYYFKKKFDAIGWGEILEGSIAASHFILGILFFRILSDYGVSDDGTGARIFLMSFWSMVWVAYWFRSKRVKATFIN